VKPCSSRSVASCTHLVASSIARDTHAHEQAAASTHMIENSPALQTREHLVFASYTDALASLIAEETGAARRRHRAVGRGRTP